MITRTVPQVGYYRIGESLKKEPQNFIPHNEARALSDAGKVYFCHHGRAVCEIRQIEKQPVMKYSSIDEAWRVRESGPTSSYGAGYLVMQAVTAHQKCGCGQCVATTV